MGAFTMRKNIPSNTSSSLTNKMSANSEIMLIESMSSFDDRGQDLLMDFSVAAYIFEADGIEEIVKEGLGDFLSGAVQFFKDLLMRILNYFKEILAYLSSYMMTFGTFIEKNKDRIENSGTVRVKGHKFTLDKEVPDMSIIDRLVSEFNSEITKVEEMSLSDLQTKIQKYNGEEHAKKLRASIVGSPTPIDRDEVSEFLFKKFRNGESDPDYIDFDNGAIRGFVSGYKDTKKEFGEIRKQQSQIEKSINSLKSFFEKGYRSQYVGSNKQLSGTKFEKDGNKYKQGEEVVFKDAAETLRVVNLYYSFRFGQMRDLSNAVILTVTARTKAYKDYLSLQEKVIRKAVFGGVKDED